jgi:hypothetical protein
MTDDDKTVKVTIALPSSVLTELQKLAASEGVSANTKLVESLMRDLYLTDKQSKGASILIQENDKSFKKVS